MAPITPFSLRSVMRVGPLLAAGFVGWAAATLLAAEPARILFDTDICSDVDDVGAVALLHALADRGEAEIVAMTISCANPDCALCLDALNTYYGRSGIPIGVVRAGGVMSDSKYVAGIAKEFPHALKSAADAPDALATLRRSLAKQPDGSVTLVSVGFLTNIAALVDSPPDAESELNGRELARRKIKVWVAMAGKFPEGAEYNVDRAAAASQRAIAKWPTPIVFSGFEIGQPIETGAGLKAAPADSPIRRAYELYNGLKNRSSWDQTAVLVGVRGLDAPRRDSEGSGEAPRAIAGPLAGGLDALWNLHGPGTVLVDARGHNRWEASSEGLHAYLEAKAPVREVAERIEALMLAPPKARAGR